MTLPTDYELPAFDAATIARMRAFASLAYETRSVAGSIYVDVGATELHVWPYETVERHTVCIIGVAGSVTVTDWLANALARPNRHGYHRGYAIGVDHAMPLLTAALRNHVPYGRRVWLASHSRGAGQGYELLRRLPPNWPVGGLVTFGAPGVYTRAALARYPHRDRIINVINGYDPVPRLAVHLHRPGRDTPGPGKWHSLKHYKPKET